LFVARHYPYPATATAATTEAAAGKSHENITPSQTLETPAFIFVEVNIFFVGEPLTKALYLSEKQPMKNGLDE